MVLPRADGTGFFTTEKPERVYKTERGARQAEQMFQHPERYKGFLKENWPENQTPEPEPEPSPEPEPPIINDWEETYIDPITHKEYVLKNDRIYGWYSLSRSWQQKINEVNSEYHTKSELIESGFETVHLSSFLEDAQDKYPNCPWTFEDIIIDLAGSGDITEIVVEE